MKFYRFTYTIDGLRLTEKELIGAESFDEALQQLFKLRGRNLKNIEFEVFDQDEEVND